MTFKKKINVKYVLKEEYSQEVNAAGEDPEPMLQFIASMVFPISYSSHCWLPAPQRWEEDLRLSLHPASPIATAANQQLPWSRGGGTSLRLLCSLSPPYQCLLCNGSLQQTASPATFAHLYPVTAFTQQQTDHTPAWKLKWKSYTWCELMI